MEMRKSMTYFGTQANNVHQDQTAPLRGAVWSGSTLFDADTQTNCILEAQVLKQYNMYMHLTLWEKVILIQGDHVFVYVFQGGYNHMHYA